MLKKLGKKLLDGFARFHNQYFIKNKDIFLRLVEEGQRPHTLIITCCDSRLDTSTIFQTDPGELFVVRNVGALVPCINSDVGSSVASAIEFGVKGLEIRNIIVLGHSMCGGILFVCNHSDNPDVFPNVHQWMVSHDFHHDANHDSCELRSIVKSVENLKKYPVILETPDVEISGVYFNIKTGHLYQQVGDDAFHCIGPKQSDEILTIKPESSAAGF